MAKLTRQTHKVFGLGGDSANFGQFGSQAVSAPITTKSIPTIQALDAWADGWQDAVALGEAPYLEDMNGVMYEHSYQIGDIFQDGIPEWDSGTTYYTGSISRKTGTFELYGSLIDDNLNNALPSQVTDGNWQYLNPPPIATGTLLDFAAASTPAGFLPCDGSAVSRSTYAALFGVIGITWGAGDASTTFNVPDFRRRVAVGSGGSGTAVLASTVGSVGGTETVTLDTTMIPAHNHGVNDSGHVHGERRSGTGGSDAGIGATAGHDGNSAGIDTNLQTDSATTGITTQNTGGGVAHNNMQPSAVVTKIIKY